MAFARSDHISRPMPRKPLELPIAVAKAFVRDMRAFHAEKSPIKRDEIASQQEGLDAERCGLV